MNKLDLFVLILLVAVDARVEVYHVDFLDTELVTQLVGNGTIFKNISRIFYLKCLASSPISWNYDADEVYNRETGSQRYPSSYSFNSSDKLNAYETSLIFPEVTFSNPERFTCESIQDKQDAVTVEIQQITNDTAIEILTWRKNTSLASDSSLEPSRCDFYVSIRYFPGHGCFARCISIVPSQRVTLINSQCTESYPQCSNNFRNLKELRNMCVGTIQGSGSNAMHEMTKIGVSTTENQVPGTIVCSSKTKRGALQYFFSGPDIISGKRKIHFSWDEVEPKDMIWIEPKELQLNRTFYIGQHVRGNWVVPNYGFIAPAYLIVNFNDTLQEKSIKYSSRKDGTMSLAFDVELNKLGTYEIGCFAHVWNVIQWVSKSVTILTQVVESPLFANKTESIALTDGDEYKTFFCEASGDPQPFAEFKTQFVDSSGSQRDLPPGVLANGSTLTFTKVTTSVQGEYICEATNSLGHSAKKVYLVEVSETCDLVNTKGSGTTITIGVLVTGLILVILGIAYFYVKFRKVNQIITGLTLKEIQEFREGKTKKGDEQETPADLVDSLAYSPIHEIPPTKFKVDTKQVLGSGEYGIVYKGTVTIESGTIEAAFKTVKNQVDSRHIKALLAELKILIYLEHHESIVNLIGAWTENLKNGEVFVIVELCTCSLLNFFRKNSSGFQSHAPELSSSSTGYVNQVNDIVEFGTVQLIQWGKEIAAGFEFMATKQIVHGDLAARNVLLTLQHVAKICDFGLARQLVDYNYIKSEQCPLPWKWMAPESLSRMKFSTKTDVWAFGVTLWEIFTLGDTPYPGLTWSINFVNQLEQGLRPSFPSRAPEELYDVMMNCWHSNPESRPTFSALKECLANVQFGSSAHSCDVRDLVA